MSTTEGAFSRASVHLELEATRRQLHSLVMTEIVPEIQQLIDEAVNEAKDPEVWKAEVRRQIDGLVRDEIRRKLTHVISMNLEVAKYLSESLDGVIRQGNLKPRTDGRWCEVQNALRLIAVERDLRKAADQPL